MRHTDAILRFLDSLGRASDGQYYLGLFHSLPRESFAILAVDGEVALDAADALALDLRYLTQLDLFPTLLFGFQDASSASRHAHATVTALERSGVGHARMDAASPGLADDIRATVRQGELPIVVLDDDSTEAHRLGLVVRMLRELKTRKLLFVRQSGRIGRREDRISVVNLATDFERLCEPGLLPSDQVEVLKATRRVLDERYDHRLLAAVTSPMNLLKELFTVKGGGTLIKRGGTINVFDSFQGVDRERLRMLLESSFRRPLDPAFLERPIERLYLEEGYRGAALVVATPAGPYLTKFSVDAQAQAEALGRDLWQLLTRDYQRLFWRCRPENPILPFYMKVCDGMVRYPQWQVFWIGMHHEELPRIVEYALRTPPDFGGSGGASQGHA